MGVKANAGWLGYAGWVVRYCNDEMNIVHLGPLQSSILFALL
jgi:hypothetical protein